MLNRVLEGKHENVEDFSHDGEGYLNKSENVGYLVTSLNKDGRMLVSKLHNVHTFRHLRVDDKVERHYTGDLDQEKGEILWIGWCEAATFIGQDGIEHHAEHCKGSQLDGQRLIHDLSSLGRCDPELQLVLFQEREAGHGHEVVFELESLLVLDFLYQIILLLFIIYYEVKITLG